MICPGNVLFDYFYTGEETKHLNLESLNVDVEAG